MPTLQGFTTKKAGWEKDVAAAVNADPTASLHLPFKAESALRVSRNPLAEFDPEFIKTPDGDTQAIEVV